MIGYNLPKSLNIDGIEYDIQSDFRAVLDILIACADPDLSDYEKQEVMYQILYIDADKIPVHCYEEACKKAVAFIDGGIDSDKKKPQKKLIDWQYDAAMIMPAVNKVAGKELRAEKYIHWWTRLRTDFFHKYCPYVKKKLSIKSWKNGKESLSGKTAIW